MNLNIKKANQIIDVSDWDELVTKTYGKPYSFQQQDGCKDRGIEWIDTTPDEDDDYENDSIPEVVNGENMGVSFKAWLERDSKQPIENQKYDWQLELFWERNFYPHANMIAEDLCKKGLLEKGVYQIYINW